MNTGDERPDDSWVQRYYERPQPERFEEEVAKWQQAGVLRSTASLPATTAFLSRIFQAAPATHLDRWSNFVSGLPRLDQKIFVIALWWADTPDTRAALQAFVERGGPEATGLRELLYISPPDLSAIGRPSTDEIDMCWGAFFATGEAAYVLPIIRGAVAPEEEAAHQTRQAARWSLKALCATHLRLRAIRDHFYEGAGSSERRSLDALFKD